MAVNKSNQKGSHFFNGQFSIGNELPIFSQEPAIALQKTCDVIVLYAWDGKYGALQGTLKIKNESFEHRFRFSMEEKEELIRQLTRLPQTVIPVILAGQSFSHEAGEKLLGLSRKCRHKFCGDPIISLLLMIIQGHFDRAIKERAKSLKDTDGEWNNFLKVLQKKGWRGLNQAHLLMALNLFPGMEKITEEKLKNRIRHAKQAWKANRSDEQALLAAGLRDERANPKTAKVSK